MMTRDQWNRYDEMQEALAVCSTRRGQNLINGVKRPMLRVLPATRSNPLGVKMVRLEPRIMNPLLVRRIVNRATDEVVFERTRIVGASQPLMNSMKLREEGRPSPLNVTFHDCCFHRTAKNAAE